LAALAPPRPRSEAGHSTAPATSPPLGDAAETRALRHVFGATPRQPAVSATKGLYGHPLGASGAIEVAITVLAIARGWLPPTTNLDDPDPACALRHVPPTGCTAQVAVAMTNSFGFGGINASLVFSHFLE